jgi:ABC transporter substrate binding protein
MPHGRASPARAVLYFDIAREKSIACARWRLSWFAVAHRAGTRSCLDRHGKTCLFQQSQKVVALAAEHKSPTMYYDSVFPAEGGLISYGASIIDGYRLAASDVGRILRGERPADLLVQQSVRIETILNVKTAKALRLEAPATVFARADEIIE